MVQAGPGSVFVVAAIQAVLLALTLAQFQTHRHELVLKNTDVYGMRCMQAPTPYSSLPFKASCARN